VIAEVESSWEQVMQVAELIEMRLDKPTTTRLLDSLRQCRMDGYDALLLDVMTRRGVFSIITDDGDFATVPDITIFTANAHILSIARREGRLKQRD
jgi:predicted nucleic acid-binding protein